MVGHTWAVRSNHIHDRPTRHVEKLDFCQKNHYTSSPIRKHFVILTFHCFSFRLCLAGFLLFSNVFCQWFHLADKFKYNTENVSTHHHLQLSVIIIFHFFIHMLSFFTDTAFYYSDSIQPEDSYLSMTLKKAIIYMYCADLIPLNWIALIICCLRKSLLQNFLHEFLKFADSFILVSHTKRDNNLSTQSHISTSLKLL